MARFDLDELNKVIENLRRLAEVPSRASADAADGISDAIQRQFDAGVDAYGEAWAPLADSTLKRTPDRNGGPLDNTSEMREGIVVQPMQGAGIQITFEDKGDVAMYHQSGTSRMPARPILPDGDDLPDEWERAISDAYEDAFDREWEKR